MLALSGFVGLTQGLAEDWLFALHSGPRRAFAPSEHLSSKVSIHNGTAYGLASARKKDFPQGSFQSRGSRFFKVDDVHGFEGIRAPPWSMKSLLLRGVRAAQSSRRICNFRITALNVSHKSFKTCARLPPGPQTLNRTVPDCAYVGIYAETAKHITLIVRPRHQAHRPCTYVNILCTYVGCSVCECVQHNQRSMCTDMGRILNSLRIRNLRT